MICISTKIVPVFHRSKRYPFSTFVYARVLNPEDKDMTRNVSQMYESAILWTKSWSLTRHITAGRAPRRSRSSRSFFESWTLQLWVCCVEIPWKPVTNTANLLVNRVGVSLIDFGLYESNLTVLLSRQFMEASLWASQIPSALWPSLLKVNIWRVYQLTLERLL